MTDFQLTLETTVGKLRKAALREQFAGESVAAS